jgi:hypothetical protein
MESYRRSAAAHAAGKFESEILPVAVPQGRGRDDVLVSPRGRGARPPSGGYLVVLETPNPYAPHCHL